MALQSQLGTTNSVLASTMAMGVPLTLGDPVSVDFIQLTDEAVPGHRGVFVDSFSSSASATVAQEMVVTSVDTLTLTDSAFEQKAIAIDTLSPTESVVLGWDSNHTVIDTLSLTEQADRGYEAVDTLVLTESADIPAEASDTITLTELAELAESLKDAFTPSESVGLVAEYNTFPSDTLTLTESAISNMDMVVAGEEDLVTTDQVFDPLTFTFNTVQTGLRDSSEVGGPLPATAFDNINLTESAFGWVLISGGFSDLASDSLSLTERADFAITLAAEDALVLTESASADVSAVAEDTLSLTDSVISAQDTALAASDSLSLFESVGISADVSDIECSYTPFVGTSTDPNAPPPPVTTYNAAGATTGFRLQFPETGMVTDEVLLRKPSFGNKDRLNFSRINHETRGGTLIIFRDPTWPEVETLVLSFSGLKQDKVDELQTFIGDHLGLEIRLIDHEDRLWKGIVSEVQNPKVEDSRERFTMSFEFEGELV